MSALDEFLTSGLHDRSGYDPGDPWGSLMGEAFAACGFAWSMGWSIPEGLGYEPGAFGPTAEDLGAWDTSEATEEEMYDYLTTLGAALDQLGEAGRSY